MAGYRVSQRGVPEARGVTGYRVSQRGVPGGKRGGRVQGESTGWRRGQVRVKCGRRGQVWVKCGSRGQVWVKCVKGAAHLVEGVLDADDRVVLAELLVDLGELLARDCLRLVLALAWCKGRGRGVGCRGGRGGRKGLW